MNDNVNHPEHYTSHPSGIECIQIAEHLPFNVGNVVKYCFRCGLKGDAIEDLEKAQWYLNREIARLKANGHAKPAKAVRRVAKKAKAKVSRLTGEAAAARRAEMLSMSDAGKSAAAIAKHFGVSLAAVYKGVKQARTEG